VFKITKAFFLIGCVLVSLALSSYAFADETEKRRVDISVSIFPRIVAVDNHFREKLDKDQKARLLFVYDEDESFAQEIADRVGKDGSNIGGMLVSTRVASVADTLPESDIPVAIFLVEKLSDAQLKKVIAYAESTHRLVFSPFSGDVERGVMVGISVTNRVKPYFNLPRLHSADVVVNALLMKMSKRYE
jgi:hypothetical protein